MDELRINNIYNLDCVEFLKSLPDNSINLIITSPPYNKSRWSRNQNVNNGFKTKSRKIDYGCFSDNMPNDIYIEWQCNVIKECIRVLKDDGSLFYNHIDILHDHTTIHPSYVYNFPVKQIIIWDRKSTPKIDKSYFLPITEYIFWIKKRKESRPFFDRKKALFNKNIWSFNPEKNNPHPAPFPIELPLNIIRTCSREGDLVLDPFMGSGTTALASVMLNRNYIGCELNADYIKMANDRIKKEKNQTNLFQTKDES